MHPTNDTTGIICHTRHSRRVPGARAHYSWSPEGGTHINFEGSHTPADHRETYLKWVSAAFATATRIDKQMQEHILDLPGQGLHPFPIEEEGIVGWLLEGTELTFATPYLAKMPTRNPGRQHSTFTLRLWAVPAYNIGEARWDNPDAIRSLVNKMRNPDALLVEVALTDSHIIESARREYEAEESAHTLSETLTRADHVPYTRVAKKIKEATRGGVYARVYPITFPNTHHVPAVAITRFRFNEAAVRRALEGDGFTHLPLPDDNNHPHRSTDFQIWVKQPSLFPTASPQVAWLESTARETTRYYSGARYAPA